LKGPLKEAHPFHLLEVGQYGEFEFIDLKDNKNAALQKHPELLLSTVSLLVISTTALGIKPII
jgi:hypothetical protein